MPSDTYSLKSTLGNAFRDLKEIDLYPSVGMKRPQAHLSVNFGQKPFVFDIDGMMKVRTFHDFILRCVANVSKHEKLSIGNEINATDVSKLHPNLDENALLKELVAQFLAHDGYVETAKAFAEEVQAEVGTLKSGSTDYFDNFDVEEDIDAVNRQRISAFLLRWIFRY